MDLIIQWVATLGVGRIPKAPGTWGSLVAVVAWWFVQPSSILLQLVFIAVAFVLGTLATAHYEKHSGRHDPKEVVVDELVGMWLTLLGAPKSLGLFILGFLLFRLFDIAKPFPIGWIDRKVPGALGTMLDDVAAGAVAYIIISLVLNYGGAQWMS